MYSRMRCMQGWKKRGADYSSPAKTLDLRTFSLSGLQAQGAFTAHEHRFADGQLAPAPKLRGQPDPDGRASPAFDGLGRGPGRRADAGPERGRAETRPVADRPDPQASQLRHREA